MSLKGYMGGLPDGEPRSATLELLSSGLFTTSGGDASGDIKCSSLSVPGCSCGCCCSCTCQYCSSEMPYMLNGTTAASDECTNGITCCSCSRRHRARRNGFLSIRRRRNGFLSIRRRRNGVLAAEEGQEGSWDGAAACTASGATAKRPTSSFRNPVPESLDGAGGPGCCCCFACCCRGGVLSDGGEDEDGANPASGNNTPLGSARASGRGTKLFSGGVTAGNEHGAVYSPTVLGGSAGTISLAVQREFMSQLQLLPLHNDNQQSEGGATIGVECDANANSRATKIRKDAQQMQPQQIQSQHPQVNGAAPEGCGTEDQLLAAYEHARPSPREHSPLQTPLETSLPLRDLQQRQQPQPLQQQQEQQPCRPCRHDSWHTAAPGTCETVTLSATPTCAVVDLTSRSDVQLYNTYVVPGSCVNSPVVRPHPPLAPCTSSRLLTQLQQPQLQQRQLQQPPPSPRPQQQQEQQQQQQPGRAYQSCQLGMETGSAAVGTVDSSRDWQLRAMHLRSAEGDNGGAMDCGVPESGQSPSPSPSLCSPRPHSEERSQQHDEKKAMAEEEVDDEEGKVAPCIQGTVRQSSGAAASAFAAASASISAQNAGGGAASTTHSNRTSGALRPAAGWVLGASPGVVGKTQSPPPLQLPSATAPMGTSPGPTTGLPLPQENPSNRAAAMVITPSGTSASPSYTPGYGRKLMPSLSQCEHLWSVESGSAFAAAAAATGVNGTPCRSPAVRTAVTTMVTPAALGKMPYRAPPRRARSLATLVAADRTVSRTNHVRQFLVTGQQVTHGSLLPQLPSPIHSVAADWSSADTAYAGTHRPKVRPRRSFSTQMNVGYHTAVDAAPGLAATPPLLGHPQQQQVNGIRYHSSPLSGITGISNLASGLSVRSRVGSGPQSRRPSHWSNTLTSALSDVEDGTEGDEDEDTQSPPHWQRPRVGVGTGIGTNAGAAVPPAGNGRRPGGGGSGAAPAAAAAAAVDNAALVAIDMCDGMSALAGTYESHPEQPVQPRQAPPSPSLPPPLSQQQQVATATGLAAALSLKSGARALSGPDTINNYGHSATAALLMGPTAAGGSPLCPPDTSVAATAVTAMVASPLPGKPISPSMPPALLPPTGAPQRRRSNDSATATVVASLTALVSRSSLVGSSRDSSSCGLAVPSTQQDGSVAGSTRSSGALQHNSWPARRGHDSGSGGNGRGLVEFAQPMVSSATPAAAATGMHNTYATTTTMPTTTTQQHPQQHLRVAPSPPSQRDSTAGQGVRLSRMVQPLRLSTRASGGGEGRGPPPLSVADVPLRNDDGDGIGATKGGGGDGTTSALSSSVSTYSSERAVKQQRSGTGQAAGLAVTAPLSSTALTPRRELQSSSVSLPPIWATASPVSPSDPCAE